MGVLELEGTIDVTQFWPEGESDADTTNVSVEIDKDAFIYISGTAKKKVHCFDDAFVIGSNKVKNPVISKKNIVKVRLQAIDAPELHYQLDARSLPIYTKRTQRDELKAIKAYRKLKQYYGEGATVALGNYLKGIGARIPCKARTNVDYPNDVFDTYGRFVGSLFIIDKEEIDLNKWIVSHGMAYPTFYSSMSKELIQEYLDIIDGMNLKSFQLWKNYSKDVDKLDPNLLYTHPKKGTTLAYNPNNDKGPIIMPKIFRRSVMHYWCTKVGITKKPLKGFMEEKRDECYALSDFLSQGPNASTTRYLDEFIDGKGMFKELPQNLVFREKPSDLVDSGNMAIADWQ
jgi:endonuclease YncB( thermonuclease family)